MAPIGISEFTFGYAFLYEQTQANWGNLRAAPVLPSLQQEHDHGWDARLPLVGTDFYYQFKLSEYLSRGNSKYISDNTYDGPYYRMSLHRKDNNRQHQRLRRHAQTNPNTFYVAPEFNRLDEFNAAFLAHQITNRTRMIPVRDCDDIEDANQHYITFRGGQTEWIQHSEKKAHERSFSGKDLGSVYEESRPRWRALNKEFAVEVFTRTKSVVNALLEREGMALGQKTLPLLDFDTNRATRAEVLIRTSEVLSVTLGTTLVLVGRMD